MKQPASEAQQGGPEAAPADAAAVPLTKPAGKTPGGSGAGRRSDCVSISVRSRCSACSPR